MPAPFTKKGVSPLYESRWNIWVELLLYPGHSLPTAAAPVVVGAGLAIHQHVFAAETALLCLVGSWLIHVGGVFTDNYELLRKHPNILEHPQLTAAIETKTLTLSHLRWAILACLVLAAFTAPYFFHIGGAPALVIGMIGVVASLGYAGGPYPYAKLGLAEPVFFIMFGIVAVVGTYYAQAAPLYGAGFARHAELQALPLSAFLIGLPIGALVTNILIIDDIRDREFDAIKGWRTGAVRFGIGWSRIRYVLLSIVAYLAPIWFWVGLEFSGWVLLPLLTLPWAYTLARAVCTKDQSDDLLPMTPRASFLSFFYSVLLATGIAVS